MGDGSSRVLHPRRPSPPLPLCSFRIPSPPERRPRRSGHSHSPNLPTPSTKSQPSALGSFVKGHHSGTCPESPLRQAVCDSLSSAHDAYDRHLHPRRRFQGLPAQVCKGRDLGHVPGQSLFRTFATSTDARLQMDLGVGSFVFSLGLVSALPLLRTPVRTPLLAAVWGSTKKSAGVLALGVGRVLMVKGVEYPVRGLSQLPRISRS